MHVIFTTKLGIPDRWRTLMMKIYIYINRYKRMGGYTVVTECVQTSRKGGRKRGDEK